MQSETTFERIRCRSGAVVKLKQIAASMRRVGHKHFLLRTLCQIVGTLFAAITLGSPRLARINPIFLGVNSEGKILA